MFRNWTKRIERARRARRVFEPLEPRLVLDGVVISEFMAVGNAVLPDDYGVYSDWIELHNPTPEVVELGDSYLTDTTSDLTQWQFPADTALQPGEYLVVFASNRNTIGPAGEIHTNFRLSGGGEYLGLIGPDGLTPQFEYTSEYPTQYSNVSYGLGPDMSSEGYFTSPTPGAANVGEPVDDPTSQIVINEIMYHPASESILEEYVELFNRGLTTVDLSGWKFVDGIDYEFGAVTIAPGEYLVVAADVGVFSAKYETVTNVVGGWTGRLSNRSDEIELADALGNRVDRVRYADQGDWAVRERGPDDRGYQGWIWTATHDGGGKSLELINPTLSNKHGQNWASGDPDEGTPGVVNSVASDDIAPMIIDVSHSPAIPHSTDEVYVTADLKNEVATGISATVYYRNDGEASFSLIAMADDGQSGDGKAGDGVYGAMLPARPDGTIVEFYIGASDAAGNTRTWPAPTQPTGEQLTNLLYQVDDSFDPDATRTPGDPATYYLLMTEAERAELADLGDGGNNSQWSDAQFNGTFISVDNINSGSDTKVRYTVGIRNRGNGSRIGPPNNFRVNIPHDDPWQDVTAVNINSRYPYLQLIGHSLFRMAGMPSEESKQIDVRVNGQNLARTGSLMYGSYVQMEAYGSEYANRQFPLDSGGNLYNGMTWSADLGYLGTDPQAYIDAGYSKKTNSSENDWSDLIELTDVLNNEPDETYVQRVDEVLDVDQWLKWFAMNSLMANQETNLSNGRGDDYSMYRGIVDPRFVLLPHDLDTIFGNGGNAGVNDSIFRATALPAINRFLTHPEFAGRYYAALIELIETVFSPEQLGPFLDQVLGDWAPQSHISQIQQWVVNRTASVLSQIPDTLSINSALPIVDGYQYTNLPTADLGGTAHASQTGSVLVDGLPTVWDPYTGTWSVGDPIPAETDTLITRGSDWKYLDDGSDLDGTNWYDTGFDDSGWAEDPGQLGYGDGDETTVISYGLDENNKHITTYFRRAFEVTDASQYASLNVQLLADDGAVLYLNGQEVIRDNMPAAPAVIDYQTLASSVTNYTVENNYLYYSIDPALLPSILNNGSNYLAVELHQVAANSPDLGFDLQLDGVMPTTPTALDLQPGVNRIEVETFAGPNGTGQRLEHEYVDIWYDPASGTTALGGGIITEDTILAPENGPYQVTGDLTVAAGATLTILPGTTVFFDTDVSLTVNGRLLAEGTGDDLIRFTRVPGGGDWGGLQFADTMQDNRIDYAVLEYGVTNNGMVGVVDSNLTIDHTTLDHTDRRRIRSIDSWLIVRNSTFTDIFPGAMAPTTDNLSEHIWGNAPYGGGHFILENNLFGTVKGHNDAVDVNGGFLANGDPAMQIIGNVFMGTGDDCLDLEGDAYIEGNLFMHNHEDQWNTSSGHAQVIAAGSGHEFFVLRNVFYDIDYVAQVKQGSFMTFENNTVIDGAEAAIYFLQPGQTYYGRGAYLDGNIFVNTPVVFADLEPTTELIVNRSILPAEYHGYGVGNLEEDPRLADPAQFDGAQFDGDWGDFSLLLGSPAKGTGPNGLDMGAMVPAGASIAGEPTALTSQTDATLTFGGPGITHIKIRVDDGLFGPETPVDTPLALSDLPDGDHTVFVIGRNSAGVWQEEAAATVSKTWTVETTTPRVRINELLAINTAAVDHEGTYPDLIELYNHGPTAFDLAGMGISDEANNPIQYIFSPGTILASGEFLVLYADSETTTSGIHLGFSLDGGGEGVFLFDASYQLVDSVEFGVQVTDLSIGRVGHEAEWALTQPTFGAANVAQRTAGPSALKINEWLADGDVLFAEDFVELYNPDPLPVPLGDLYLTDHPVAWPDKHQIAPLSFIAGSGFAWFVADEDLDQGANHLDFKLAARQEQIGLFDPSLNLIDQVIYYPQTTDYSQGRKPDGGDTFDFFSLPTPGLPVPSVQNNSVAQIAIDDAWSFNDYGFNMGTEWSDYAYDDLTWPVGDALFFAETAELPGPKNTPINLGAITYYFRTHFNLDADPNDLTSFQISPLLDDGAVIYINGVEVYRLRMDDGDVDYRTLANPGIGNAAYDGPFDLPTAALQQGDNVIAVEVHQATAGSSDIVFGLTLDATVESGGNEMTGAYDLLGGLRITEIMYHPSGDADAEFIELQNVGPAPLELGGVRFTQGIEFTFPEMTLAPDEYVVLVRDLPTFISRYGDTANVAGQYVGSLSNGGEDLVVKLPSPLEASLMRFDYNDTWHPITDGAGYSLQIIDPAAEASTWDYRESWSAVLPSPGAGSITSGVVDRHVFYNNSTWDNTDKGRTDNEAVAPDKTALRPGSAATFANYTSYSRGINGLMVDIYGVRNFDQLTPSDFTIKVGNDNDPANWAPGPSPISVTVLAGQGTGNSDRVVLAFADNAIRNEWVEVTVPSGIETGLAAEDVFYFGHAAGETGNSPTDASVDAWDVLETRNNPRPFWNPATLETRYDFNRDQRVNAIDTLIARNNQTWSATELQLIDLSVAKAGKRKSVASKAITHAAVFATESTEPVKSESSPAADWIYQIEQPEHSSKRESTQTAIDKLWTLLGS